MKLSKFILKVVAKCSEFGQDEPLPYIPDSTTWHEPQTMETGDEVCFACLAGIYAAAQNWLKPDQHVYPLDENPEANPLSEEQNNLCGALDCIRVGNWSTAQHYLGIPAEERIPDKDYRKVRAPTTRYFIGWKSFHVHLLCLRNRAIELHKLGY